MSGSVSQSVSALVHQWVSLSMNEGVSQSVSALVHRWVSLSMNEGVSQSVSQCIRVSQQFLGKYLPLRSYSYDHDTHSTGINLVCFLRTIRFVCLQMGHHGCPSFLSHVSTCNTKTSWGITWQTATEQWCIQTEWEWILLSVTHVV